MIDAMNDSQILNYLRENVVPMGHQVYGLQYRASVTLTDGTHLPCVLFTDAEMRTSLAIRRFQETASSDEFQRTLVAESFVVEQATIRTRDISDVTLSPFAWPEEILRQIHGETTMGWTAFTAHMRDGNVFGFGTPFNFEFFDLPTGYTYNDITEIRSGMIIDSNGKERRFEHDVKANYYRDRLFFVCYARGLPRR